VDRRDGVLRVEAGSEPLHDDRTIDTVDYDYKATFGGRGVWSVSDVGGTVGSHMHRTCLDDVIVDGTGGTVAMTIAITAVDEPGAVADDDRTTLYNTTCNDARKVLLYVYAPSRRLGVVIDTLLRRWRGARFCSARQRQAQQCAWGGGQLGRGGGGETSTQWGGDSDGGDNNVQQLHKIKLYAYFFHLHSCGGSGATAH
jgi:hypothetical protein